MSTNKLLVNPTYLDFGEVEVGDVATHQLTLTNNSHEPLALNVSIMRGGTDDFLVSEGLNITKMQPLEEKHLSIDFTPKASGLRRQTLNISMHNASENLDKHIIFLNGIGCAIGRFSYRKVDLPRREIEKAMPHYVLGISNRTYIENLKAHKARKLHWYAALPAGTHGGTVSPTKIKPGQVPLPREASLTDKFSIIHGFDVQLVSARWRAPERRTITDVQTCQNVDEALGHTTDVCFSQIQVCNNRFPNENVNRNYENCLSMTRNQGEIFTFYKKNKKRIGIIISNPWLSAYYHSCFKERVALVVRAVEAHCDENPELNDRTTLYGVRAQPIRDVGELWIPCYTVTMMSIDELKRPYLRLEFSKRRLSRQDIMAVQERVRLYLGMES